MPRKPKYETPRNQIVSFKITEEQAESLEKLVNESGLQKTDIVYKALLYTLLKAPEVSAKVFKKVPDMIKSGTFSAGAVSKAFDEALFGSLDEMYIKECKKVIENKKKGKSSKKSFPDILGKAAL